MVAGIAGFFQANSKKSKKKFAFSQFTPYLCCIKHTHMKKIIIFAFLLFIAATVNAQTFKKLDGVKTTTDCVTFTVTKSTDSDEYIVIAANQNGNEVTRWYFPATCATFTEKEVKFDRGLRTYRLTKPAKAGK